MDTILAGLSKTKAYLDDICFGATLQEAHENVRKVLKRPTEFNVKVNE